MDVRGGGSAGFAERRGEARVDADRRLHHDAIYAFARAAERHDPDTGRHVVRIRLVVERLATALGLPDAEALGYDAMLHDVGKLAVPESILGKPGPLTPDERRLIDAHTIHGERILSGLPTMARAARIARSHHECWDGTGQPDGLRGEAIPIEARVTAAADVLDALVAARSYKSAWSSEDAIDTVETLAGTRLDPTVAAALRRCHEQGALEGVWD